MENLEVVDNTGRDPPSWDSQSVMSRLASRDAPPVSRGGIASNGHLSVHVNKANGSTEVLTCIGGWGGGTLHYATIDSPTSATWTGPLVLPNQARSRDGCAHASHVDGAARAAHPGGVCMQHVTSPFRT